MSMENQLDLWAGTAEAIARQAGESIMSYYGAEVAVHLKGGNARDLVTDADLAADEAISAGLREAFPHHAVLSEEAYRPGDRIDDQVPTWIVDPIDGTSNFAHRLPFFAVSIGLQVDGQLQVGVIHAPALAWTFVAARGRGATLNDLPLYVSERDSIDQAIGCCDWPRQPALRELALAAHGKLAEQAHTMRSLGSAALGFAAVAAGWVDLYFNYSLAPWDTAAGALLVREAGGRVTTLEGEPWQVERSRVLVSNGRLHDQVATLIAPHLPGQSGGAQ